MSLFRTVVFGYCFASGLLLSVYGQGTLDVISHKFEKYSGQALTEKLFVHTDRQFYVSGETLWFKIYGVDGTLHKPLDLSKVVYLEVMDKDQKPVLQSKVALKESRGNGSLFLPASLPSGNYTVRAYTQWMRNFSPDYFFHQAITIVNPFRRLDLPPVPDSASLDIQFFPEGGNLVHNIPAKVAFKAVDPQGKGIPFRGVLVAPGGDTLTTFAPLHFGMGHFSFTPQAGVAYKALLRDEAGRVVTAGLPRVYQAGYVMQLQEAGNNQLRITVTVSPEVAGSGAASVHLLAQTRQSVKVTQSQALQDYKAIFTLDKTTLGAGVSQLTLFNEKAQPVCERLYFRRPAQKLEITIQTNKNQYASREKITLDLLVKDGAGKPQLSDMSVAVFRMDSLEKQTQPEILSYLWLQSDLRGPIESPDYYFNPSSADAEAAADNLMLTQGWRRFRWEDVLGKDSTIFAFPPELDGPMLRGKVINSKTGAPAPNIFTYLSAPGKPIRVYVAKSDSRGRVHFEMKNFYGPKEVVIQTNQKKDSLYRFELDGPFAAQTATYPVPTLQIPARLAEPLRERNLGMQVNNVYTPQQKNQFLMPAMDTSAFYGKPDESYQLDDFTRFTTMEDVLREYVIGAFARKRRDGYELMVYDRPHDSNILTDPMVLLDGVPVFDMDQLMAMSPLKIKQLDVMTRRYYLGRLKFNGLISLQTYKGNLAGFAVNPRSLIQEYEGLQLHREFYAPRYDQAEQLQSRLPDFRNLLYWSPDVPTDSQGKARLDFFTSDQEGTYRIVVNGLTRAGVAGSQSVIIRVQHPVK